MAEDRRIEALQVTGVTEATFFDGATGEEITTLQSAADAGYSSGEWARENGVTVTWDSKGLFGLS